MISQAEILKLAQVKGQLEEAKKAYEAVRDSLVERVVANEETEAGQYGLKHTSFSKTSTAYKPVLEGIQPTLNPEQTTLLVSLLASNSTTRNENRIEAVEVTEEVVVVKKTKKLKAA